METHSTTGCGSRLKRTVYLIGVLFVFGLVAGPVHVSSQDLSFTPEGGVILSVSNASELLNGNILGLSLDEVLDNAMASFLNEAGLRFVNDSVSFLVKLDDEVVAKRKCLYKSEVRDATVGGIVETSNSVNFTANQNFMVTGELDLPLDVVLEGILHTDIFAHAIFTCIRLKGLDFPFRSEVTANVKIRLMVYLNPKVQRKKKKGKVLLRLAPEVKILQSIDDIDSNTELNVKFKGFRIRFIEDWIEKVMDRAIETNGERVIAAIIEGLESDLQDYLDKDIKGKKIDLEGLIDDAEARGVLTNLIAAARLAFSIL